MTEMNPRLHISYLTDIGSVLVSLWVGALLALTPYIANQNKQETQGA